MKYYLISCFIFASFSSLACELNTNKASHVDTWTALSRDNIISSDWTESSTLKIQDTTLGSMSPHELLRYALKFNVIQTSWGNKGSSQTTTQIFREAVEKNLNLCEFAEAIDKHYKFHDE